MLTSQTIDAAYRHCIDIANAHYENFPVASILVPEKLRGPIAAVYAFARTADDYADEGIRDDATRYALLDAYVSKLDQIKDRHADIDPVFIALYDLIHHRGLPLEPFYDLLTAFRMDVSKKRYANFDEVLTYCRYSANPVGRLLLHLFDKATAENIACSDAICSALQLINFLQDIEQDYRESGRIYLPQDEMQQCGINDEDIAAHRHSEKLDRLLDIQITRIYRMMQQGAPLGWIIPGRVGFELRMTIFGGLRVLHHLHHRRDDRLSRPRLRKADWCWIAGKALFGTRQLPAAGIGTSLNTSQI